MASKAQRRRRADRRRRAAAPVEVDRVEPAIAEPVEPAAAEPAAAEPAEALEVEGPPAVPVTRRDFLAWEVALSPVLTAPSRRRCGPGGHDIAPGSRMVVTSFERFAHPSCVPRTPFTHRVGEVWPPADAVDDDEVPS